MITVYFMYKLEAEFYQFFSFFNIGCHLSIEIIALTVE